MATNEELAQAFHEAYERLAPVFNYKTRDESAVAWEDVPENNKRLMVAVVSEVRELFQPPVPDEAKLDAGQIVATMMGTGTAQGIADAATEKAYPLGYKDGQDSRDAEVAELREQLDAARESHAELLGHAEDIEQLKRELDAALEQVRALVEALEAHRIATDRQYACAMGTPKARNFLMEANQQVADANTLGDAAIAAVEEAQDELG